ncbi:hypothetical protein CONLIGDRAFT_159355 [Coniochaeta ligniaria NRRL 30616]|uniref:Uncharacterized protein n=1 Tax=Coniochaeta ligniaria NRRL 30616 TaxID=1408157 RepID=A0A1J7J0D7_9PEZI|nr:hypothetical protein CONLIGDRAFT_159355 [Coniochaeta ligniaria NRRL 30616]
MSLDVESFVCCMNTVAEMHLLGYYEVRSWFQHLRLPGTDLLLLNGRHNCAPDGKQLRAQDSPSLFGLAWRQATANDANSCTPSVAINALNSGEENFLFAPCSCLPPIRPQGEHRIDYQATIGRVLPATEARYGAEATRAGRTPLARSRRSSPLTTVRRTGSTSNATNIAKTDLCIRRDRNHDFILGLSYYCQQYQSPVISGHEAVTA